MSGTSRNPRRKAATKNTGKDRSKETRNSSTKRNARTPAKTRAAASRSQPASAQPQKYGSELSIYGVAPYRPKKNEEYMSDGQLEHFRGILERWKNDLMEEVDRTIHHLRDEASSFPDANDRATQETEFGLELKTRDRERKLIRKIDAALERITQRTYGYCEETGEEIGLGRLEARPIATLCLEAQERYEKTERHFDSPDGGQAVS